SCSWTLPFPDAHARGDAPSHSNGLICNLALDAQFIDAGADEAARGSWSLVRAPSLLAHARLRLFRAAAAHLLLDAPADFGVDASPVLQRAFEHRRAHAAEQASCNLIDERIALRVV